MVMLLLLENRLPQLDVSLDKDTDPFAVEPRLWGKIVVLDLHIAEVCLIQLHIHTSKDARSSQIEFLIRKSDAGADAGPDSTMVLRSASYLSSRS